MNLQSITDYRTNLVKEDFSIGLLKKVMDMGEENVANTLSSMPAPELKIPGIGENIDILA